jgi:ElaB/YqjD/DUF883 family membrane-anchored ribosome-binding protein
MADHDPLIVRGDPQLPMYREGESEADRLRHRLVENKARLREAIEAMEAAAKELTPAARIRHNPMRWVAGAFAVGLVLGWLTGRPRF